MRRWINRYSITFGLIGLAVLGWNLYVAAHRDGLLTGRVAAADGSAIAGATVKVRERTMVSSEPRAEAKTDAQGRFRVEGLDYHHLLVEVEAQGFKPLPRQSVRLWFRGQNRALEAPLTMERAG
ncbi:MAG: carboxypeptidase regulatory-like domain-containing protein [Alphaproteobacteria bacterium]|nr:carboxypeptidase regulatory-like domain-containing protein [Alphaproteobacteria bacterium]